MFFTIKKYRARIDELKELRYKEIHSINNWMIKEDCSKCEKYPPTNDEGFSPFYLGDIWGGRDSYYWIKTKLDIPSSEEDILLLIDLGKTGAGNNSGFESLLFIDSKPYQAVDKNHQEIFIGKCYYGQTVEIALKLWTGLEGGGVRKMQSHKFKRGDQVILDLYCDHFFYLTDALCKTLEELDDTNPQKHIINNLMKNSFKLINWSYPRSQEFYDSIRRAYQLLEDELAKNKEDSIINFTAIGHTHIDLAWLWQYKHTQEKAARSFSTVLRLMDRYPEYVFLQTQPQIYEFISNEYPEIYEDIKVKVKEGIWEVDGAMWVEADCNIPSGESLVRQILFGSRYIKKEFDKDINYLWLPDVFGYSWALPQILKKSNISTFMTTKISWNQYNRMPHDTFWWSGIDGSKVLTHFITTPEIDHDDHSDWYYTYNGHVEPETLLGSYEGYRDKNINQDILLAYGYGDGGGGVTRDMLEKIRVLDKIPSLPNIKTGKAKDYFEKLHHNISNSSDYVHTWDGELYLEYHRGTYTSQAFVKKTNRQVELLLRNLEILYFMSHVKFNTSYPLEELNSVWKTLLKNQFHDVIPGSSIAEVYEDYRDDAKDMTNSLKELTNKISLYNENIWSVVNTCGWTRTGYAKISINKTGKFYLDGIDELTSTKVEDGYIVEINEIKPLESKTVVFKEDDSVVSNQLEKIDLQNSIETEYYRIQWNDAGQIISLYDKQVSREVVKKGSVINKLVVYEDKPLKFDAWDIDIFYQEKYQILNANKIEITDNNMFYFNVCFNYEFGKSQLQQNMKVYKNKRRIDFVTSVDWYEHQRLLRALFDVDIRSTEATYDIQYGNVKRPTHWNTSWDMAKFETVAHQWIDLSENNYGVSLMNDCKYGHSVKENIMGITLLKGAIEPDTNADQGNHSFTYSLMPHQNDFINGGTVKEAWDLNDELLVLSGDLDFNRLIEINDDVCIDTIKQAEDKNGWIIRIHDHTGGTRNINIKLNFEVEKWCEVNLLEEESGVYCSSNNINVRLKPYEIKTFKMILKR